MSTEERRLNKRWLKLCADIAQLARERGAKEPFIFACETGLCITDGQPTSGAEVLFTLQKPPSALINYDSGGW